MRTGFKASVFSRALNLDHNLGLGILVTIAEALNCEIRISFVSRQEKREGCFSQ